jgi:Ca2+-binding EF-hand superfamily protein
MMTPRGRFSVLGGGLLLRPQRVDSTAAPFTNSMDERPLTMSKAKTGPPQQLAYHAESTETQQHQKDSTDNSGSEPNSPTNRFDSISKIARKNNLGLNEVRKLRREFDRLDTSGDGKLDFAEFEETVRMVCQIPHGTEVPEHLWKSRWISVCQGKPRQEIEFEEYLTWRRSVSYTEEVLVPCSDERRLRQVARDNSITIVDVENLKRKFDKYDVDKSGFIDQEEFKSVLCDIMKVDRSDVSQAMLDRYYTEADSDGTGEIDFFEFVEWYCKFM